MVPLETMNTSRKMKSVFDYYDNSMEYPCLVYMWLVKNFYLNILVAVCNKKHVVDNCSLASLASDHIVFFSLYI